jgi:hypothetical protein
VVYNINGGYMIKEIIQQIREQQELARKPLVDDVRTMSTQLGNIKRAEENINELYLSLRNEVMTNGIVILVSGSGSEKFAKIAEENYACFSFDAKDFFRHVSSYVDDVYLNNTITSSVFDIAMGAMSDLSHEIGILGYNYLQFKNEDARQVKNREEFVDLLANAFSREIGSEVVILDAIHKTAKKIMDGDFEGSKVPLILYSKDDKIIESLNKDSKNVTKNVFLIKTTKTVKESDVENNLIKIKEQLQKENV